MSFPFSPPYSTYIIIVSQIAIIQYILGLSGGLAGLLLIPFGRIADSSGLINAMMFLLIPLLIVTVFTMVLPEMRKKC